MKIIRREGPFFHPADCTCRLCTTKDGNKQGVYVTYVSFDKDEVSKTTQDERHEMIRQQFGRDASTRGVIAICNTEGENIA